MMFRTSPFLLALLLLSAFFSACQETSTSDKPNDSELQLPDSSNEEDVNESLELLEQTPFEERLADYESKDRVFWQKPDLVIDLLGDLSDKVVADIGAGSGYFARRLAHKAKKVIAIDIDEQFIQFMDSIKMVGLPKEVQGRFETRLAVPEDPRLAPDEADISIMVNTYLYIADRVDYLKRLKNGLAPGGRLVIIDYKKKRIPISNPPASMRIPLFQVENELTEAGYELLRSDDTSLDYQYIVIARKQ